MKKNQQVLLAKKLIFLSGHDRKREKKIFLNLYKQCLNRRLRK